jgi:hypothetical protein
VSLAVVVGCANEPATTAGSALNPEQLVFLTRSGCVNTDVMRERLDQALGALGVPANYKFIEMETLSKNDVRLGYPTPTLLCIETPTSSACRNRRRLFQRRPDTSTRTEFRPPT